MPNEVKIVVTSADKTAPGFTSAQGGADQVIGSFERVGEASERTSTRTARMGAGFSKFGRALEKDVGVRVDKVGGGLDLLSQFIGGPLGAALSGGAFAFSTISTALSIVSLANMRAAATWVGHKVAMVATSIATKAMTAAQWALNVAMRANPIGIVITALTLVAAGVVLAYRRFEVFRRFVNFLWSALRNGFGWVRRNWPLLLAILTGPIGLAVLAISRHKDKIIGFFRKIPGAIKGAFSTVTAAITAPFRAAVDGIRNAWNNLLGGKGFSVPDWVPGLGGKSFRIPYLAHGGIASGLAGGWAMVGDRGRELVRLPSGSSVIPNGTTERMLATGGTTRVVLEIRSGGSRIDDALVELLRKAIRQQGGNVQTVLGR